MLPPHAPTHSTLPRPPPGIQTGSVTHTDRSKRNTGSRSLRREMKFPGHVTNGRQRAPAQAAEDDLACVASLVDDVPRGRAAGHLPALGRSVGVCDVRRRETSNQMVRVSACFQTDRGENSPPSATELSLLECRRPRAVNQRSLASQKLRSQPSTPLERVWLTDWRVHVRVGEKTSCYTSCRCRCENKTLGGHSEAAIVAFMFQ